MTLALASDLSFKSTKVALKHIFGEKSYMNILNYNNISSDPIIKEVGAFYTTQKKYKKEKQKIKSSNITRKNLAMCNL